jgi:hypothetical protein
MGRSITPGGGRFNNPFPPYPRGIAKSLRSMAHPPRYVNGTPSGGSSTLRHNEENPDRYSTWHFVTCLGPVAEYLLEIVPRLTGEPKGLPALQCVHVACESDVCDIY